MAHQTVCLSPYHNPEKNIALSPFGYWPPSHKKKVKVRGRLMMGFCILLLLSISTLVGCKNADASKELVKTAVDSAINASFGHQDDARPIKYVMLGTVKRWLRYEFGQR